MAYRLGLGFANAGNMSMTVITDHKKLVKKQSVLDISSGGNCTANIGENAADFSGVPGRGSFAPALWTVVRRSNVPALIHV